MIRFQIRDQRQRAPGTAGRPARGCGSHRLGLIGAAVAMTLGAAEGANAQQTGTLVTGQVYDSIARQRIPGVEVQFTSAAAPGAGRPFSAVTDSAGRYSIAGVPPGRYLAGFFHAALDTLGLELPARLVDVGTGSQRVDFATPSPRTIMRSVCPTMNPDSTGLFMGSVRATEHQGTIADATVTVEWSDYVLDRMFIYERPRRTSTRTTGPGWFAFCGLPPDAALHVRAARGADSSGIVEVEIPTGGVRHQTFHIGGATQVTVRPDDSLAARGLPPMPAKILLRGDARLTGTVLDPNGRPVANAHVLVWGTDVDVTTGERGTFAIDGLPGGTHTLEVRVIGYVPITRVVHLASSRPAGIEIRLDRVAVILASETIRGKLVYSRQLVEFDRRRRSGFGKYITTEEIDRRPNARLAQLLQGVMGVYVRGSGANSQVSMSSVRGFCTPSLYVDGHSHYTADFDFLYADEIAGIEVYPRESQRPAGYTDLNRCGAVLVWTRSRATKPRKDQ